MQYWQVLVGLFCQIHIGWTQSISNSTISCSIPSFYPSGVIVAGSNISGSQSQFLSLPYGLFVGANDSVYVADVGNDRVQLWSYGAITGITVAGGQGYGSNSSQLDGARAVHVISPDNLIVLDTGNQRLQQYNLSTGSHLGVTLLSNLPMSCRNMFLEATAGIMYLSDMYNHRVLRLPGGTVQAGGNGFGSQPNQLYYPAGIFVTSTQTIYIADSFNDRIQMWVSGATVGVTVAGGNSRGSGAHQLNSPMHVIYVVSTGNLIITDSGNARIQVWAPNATCGITIISGQFMYPIFSTFDLMNTNLYVVDQVRNQVKRFDLLSSNSLCIPGNCSVVALSTTLTTTASTLLTSNTSSTVSVSTSLTAESTSERIPFWSITILVVGTVLLIVMASSVYVLINIMKHSVKVVPND